MQDGCGRPRRRRRLVPLGRLFRYRAATAVAAAARPPSLRTSSSWGSGRRCNPPLRPPSTCVFSLSFCVGLLFLLALSVPWRPRCRQQWSVYVWFPTPPVFPTPGAALVAGMATALLMTRVLPHPCSLCVTCFGRLLFVVSTLENSPLSGREAGGGRRVRTGRNATVATAHRQDGGGGGGGVVAGADAPAWGVAGTAHW